MLRVACVMAVVLALTGAAAASAATVTVGETTLSSSLPSVLGAGQNVPVFQGATSGGYTLTPGVFGTIDSWRFMSAGVATGRTYELAVLAPQDATGTSWRLEALSPPRAVTTGTGVDGVNGPFALSPGIPIAAVDRIALVATDGNDVPIETGTMSQDGVRYFLHPFSAVGATQAIDGNSTANNAQILPVQATIQYLQSTSPPAITGTAAAGQTLTCSPGAWTPAADAYTYQWLRDGAPLAGATSSTYVPAVADEAHVLACRVTATLGTTASGQATSGATDPVKPGAPPVPSNTSLPTISGTAQRFLTLTADPGLWINGVTSFRYQWLRCAAADGTKCAPVTGATSATYALGYDDIGSTMRVVVTAANGSGDSQPAQSAQSAVVTRGVIAAHLTVTPEITCTGVVTKIDASGSVSPDGIKSYRIDLLDLGYGAPLNDERDYETYVAARVFFLGELTPSQVDQMTYAFYTTPVVNRAYTWNRANLDDPGILERDPVGVYLEVRDYAGATADTSTAFVFGPSAFQSTADGRKGCPDTTTVKGRSVNAARLAASVLQVHGSGAKTTVSTSVACRASASCTAGVTVSTRRLVACRACAASSAKAKAGVVLARGLATVPGQRTRTVRLALTKQGRRALALLRHGGAIRVKVMVTSASDTGATVSHTSSALLR